MADFPTVTLPKKSILGMGALELKALQPEVLFEYLEPLILKWSNSFIPGFDFDDRRQEILVVIWKCQMKYDPDGKRGYEDRSASFLSFVIHSIKMRLGNCKYTGERQQYATKNLQCWGCGLTVPVFSKEKNCPTCNGTQWKTLRDVHIASVDQLSEYSDSWQPGKTDEYTFGFEADTAIDRIVGCFPTKRQPVIKSALLRGKLTQKMREQVLAAIKSDPGILYAGASSPIFGLDALEG